VVISEQTRYWVDSREGLRHGIGRVVLQMPSGEWSCTYCRRGSTGAISTNRFMLAHNTFTHNTYDANVILGFRFSELKS
jgi:hypothetical protein